MAHPRPVARQVGSGAYKPTNLCPRGQHRHVTADELEVLSCSYPALTKSLCSAQWCRTAPQVDVVTCAADRCKAAGLALTPSQTRSHHPML